LISRQKAGLWAFLFQWGDSHHHLPPVDVSDGATATEAAMDEAGRLEIAGGIGGTGGCEIVGVKDHQESSRIQ